MIHLYKIVSIYHKMSKKHGKQKLKKTLTFALNKQR